MYGCFFIIHQLGWHTVVLQDQYRHVDKLIANSSGMGDLPKEPLSLSFREETCMRLYRSLTAGLGDKLQFLWKRAALECHRLLSL